MQSFKAKKYLHRY